MSQPELSVIIPVRNRGGARLRNCLRSLRWQDVDPTRVEIVLSDFGSQAEHAASVRQLADQFSAQVERTDTDEVWNRARALNIGIQTASARWVLCTDADMIFAPNFVSTILDVHADTSLDAMIHCRCCDLPDTVAEQDWELADFEQLRSQAQVWDWRGTGACQSARRSFFYRTRGYDEQFVYWGAEDRDMTNRAQRDGLQIVWITDRTCMLHQWHRTTKSDRRLIFHLNRWRMRLTDWMIVKNRHGWGKLP